MADNNDQAASALISALTPKLVETLLPALKQQTEESIAGVLRKNGELLSKLAKKEGVEMPAAKTVDGAHLISKEDARDVQKYRAAKARAQKEGVELRIQGRNG